MEHRCESIRYREQTAVKPRWEDRTGQRYRMSAQCGGAEAPLGLRLAVLAEAKRKGEGARSMLLLLCAARPLCTQTRMKRIARRRGRERERERGREACTHLKFAIQHYSAPARRLPSFLLTDDSFLRASAAPVLTCKNDTIDTSKGGGEALARQRTG